MKMVCLVEEFIFCLFNFLKFNIEGCYVFGDFLDDLMDIGIDRK